MKSDDDEAARAYQIRSAICCAIVPLGNTTAAGLPSSPAIPASRSVTSAPSP